jgi:hypothetical protein
MSAVLVFAFDPVPEFGNRVGIIACDDEAVAARLLAAHRVERMDQHACEPLRYVAGSPAHAAACAQLRAALACAPQNAPPPSRRARLSAKE